MPNLKFTKMNGAGNDFILIDKDLNPKVKLSSKAISEMCNRKKGIGADGLLLIDKHTKYDFKLKYYNSDGEIGSLCGNGSRCAISYAVSEYKIKSDIVKFLCDGIVYKGESLNKNLIKFYLPKPSKVDLFIQIKSKNFTVVGSYVDSGSPHVVIVWDDIKKIVKGNFSNFDLSKLGKEVRFAKQFSPKGTNANIVKIEKNKIKIRTYERGVEDETLACGTGAVAASVVLSRKFGIKSPIIFNTKGGDILQISFNVKDKKINQISLLGPAKINYTGNYIL
ncbi:MAG: diaminopimelate epimerase [Ignavibacteriae bacterium]|nr:diaminopimelate epimerase [Ignavibacteriota bacterium]